MFGGKQAVSINAWAQQPADDQLQNVKTMGMVFEYMNDPKVWEMFCAVYEAIYKRLGEFDDFHASLNRGFPKLQDEWPKFIDAVLTSTANRSKGTLQWMWRKRAYVYSLSSIFLNIIGANYICREKDNTFYNLIWGVNILKNVRKITLPGTCPNLPRS
jgi:chitinase